MDTIDVGVTVQGLLRTTDAMHTFAPLVWGSVFLTPAEFLLLERCFVRPPSPVRLSEAYGLTTHVSTGVEKRPKGSLRQLSKWNGEVDRLNYANNLFSLLQFPVDAPDGAEKGVIHASLNGDYRPVGTALYSVYSSEVPFYGTSLLCPEEISPWVYGYSLRRYVSPDLGSIGHNQTPTGDYFTGLWGEFSRHAKQLASLVDAVSGAQFGWTVPQLGWDGFGGGDGSIRNFSWGLDPTPWYTYEGWKFSPFWALHVNRSVRISVAPLYSTGVPTLDGSAMVYAGSVTYEDTVDLYYNFAPGFPFGFWVPYPGYQRMHSTETLSREVNSGVVGRAVGSDEQAALDRKIYKAVQARDRDLSGQAKRLRRYAPLAVADAVDKFKVSSNYLEAISELDGVGEYLFGPLGVAERLSHESTVLSLTLAIGDLSLKRVSRFLLALADELSGLVLFYSFGVKPTAADVDNALNSANTLREIARVLDRPHYGRGSTQSAFVHGPHTFKLKVRSKFSVPKPSAGIVLEALRLDRQGLFPKPSALLDIVPFVFLLNYVFKVQERWGMIESYLFLAALRANTFVHSYELRLGEDTDRFLGVEFEPLDQCEFVFYAREVSAFVPDFSREGEDNIVPPRSPNAAVLLSLLWQFLRSAIRFVIKA